MRNYLSRFSQKIAGVGFVSGVVFSFAIQPYVEVFTRWSQMKLSIDVEVRPSDRIFRITEKVFAKFNLPDQVSQKLDIFLTDSAESVSLGAFSGSSYTFIGLPYFCNYTSEDEIPLENLNFATPLFPHSEYSSIGKERTKLMILSDDILEFLITREVLSLLGSSKLPTLPNAPQTVSKFVFPSPRTASTISSLCLVTTLYFAYQVCYALNRLLILHALPFRLLGYLSITGLLLLCQRQLLVAWRRRVCFIQDAAVAQLGDDMRRKGVAYYSWKLDWNSFWSHRWSECQKAMKVLKQVTRGLQENSIPPLIKYQLQMAVNDSSYLHLNPTDYYFIPTPITACTNRNMLRLDNCNLRCLKHVLPAYRANSLTGDEKFASDGQSLTLTFSGLLAFGAFPASFAALLELFSSPATSSMRRAALQLPT